MSKGKRVLMVRTRDGRRRYVDAEDVGRYGTFGWLKATKAEADAGGYDLTTGEETTKATNEKAGA
jgi:hypothetical protein